MVCLLVFIRGMSAKGVQKIAAATLDSLQFSPPTPRIADLLFERTAHVFPKNAPFFRCPGVATRGFFTALAPYLFFALPCASERGH